MGSVGSSSVASAAIEPVVAGVVSGSIGGSIDAIKNNKKKKYTYKGIEYDDLKEKENSNL